MPPTALSTALHINYVFIPFEDKKVAKQKKGDFLFDDLWCLKYLPKFKWHHLNEQIGDYGSPRRFGVADVV
jgi:hypothetical protein